MCAGLQSRIARNACCATCASTSRKPQRVNEHMIPPIATALVRGLSAHEDLARHAVATAMERAQLTHANSVLLFLTPEFARDPQPALRAASKAANCMQVVGCTAAGIFTEQEWVLDAPA